MKCIMFCKFIGGETTHRRCLVIRYEVLLGLRKKERERKRREGIKEREREKEEDINIITKMYHMV